MPRRCCALHCTNRSQKGSCVSFHRLPFGKPDLLEHWLENIKRKDWKPSKYSHLCSDHFENSCYKVVRHKRRVLRKTAVPTKFKFTDKECKEFQLAKISQGHQTCLVRENSLEKETGDGLAKSPIKCNASPVENGNIENHIENKSPNDACRSVKPSTNEIPEASKAESDTSEVTLTDDDDNLAESTNGSLDEHDIEDISDDSESSIQYVATLSVDDIFKAREVILISSDSEHSAKSLPEYECNDTLYKPQSLPGKQGQKGSPLPGKGRWTVSWSDTVFLEDFVDGKKLPLSASPPKKSNVKIKKVVYYGEQKNHLAKFRLNKLFLEDNSIAKDSYPVHVKQEPIETSNVLQKENATTNCTLLEHTDSKIKTEIINHDTTQEKVQSDKLVQEVGKNNLNITKCHSDGASIPNSAIIEQEADIISQHNAGVRHQVSNNNLASVSKEGKRTSINYYPSKSNVINGHSLSESPSNARPKEEKQLNTFKYTPPAINGHTDNISKSEKEHYDEIISKQNRQLLILRKRLKKCKKQIAQKNRTISILNAELVNLDFMNPYR